jgi:hypothetical protein
MIVISSAHRVYPHAPWLSSATCHALNVLKGLVIFSRTGNATILPLAHMPSGLGSMSLLCSDTFAGLGSTVRATICQLGIVHGKITGSNEMIVGESLMKEHGVRNPKDRKLRGWKCVETGPVSSMVIICSFWKRRTQSHVSP